MFKIFGDNIHGQRGYLNQIYENFALQITANTLRSSVLDGMIDFNMKSFLNTINTNSQTQTQTQTNNYLKKAKKITQNSIKFLIDNNLTEFLDNGAEILESYSCLINGLGIYSLTHFVL